MTEENFRKCGKLIEYPEDGEWIRGNTLSLSVSGNSSASWYLNNVKLSGQNHKLKLPNADLVDKCAFFLGLHNVKIKNQTLKKLSKKIFSSL